MIYGDNVYKTIKSIFLILALGFLSTSICANSDSKKYYGKIRSGRKLVKSNSIIKVISNNKMKIIGRCRKLNSRSKIVLGRISFSGPFTSKGLTASYRNSDRRRRSRPRSNYVYLRFKISGDSFLINMSLPNYRRSLRIRMKSN